MGTIMIEDIQLKGGTEEDILQSTFKEREPVIATDIGKLFYGGEDGKPVEAAGGSGGGSGADGKSAYELAVDSGFSGTEAEWLESLKGEKGEDGESAYDIAVKNGFEGTLEEWLESLQGADGESGADGNDGLPGRDGESAYEIAVRNGFFGTETEWLDSVTNNETTIVEGENILNSSVIGVSGTIKRRTLSANTQTVMEFQATSGDIDTINSAGAWVCPSNGVYTISANYGGFVSGSVTNQYYRKNGISCATNLGPSSSGISVFTAVMPLNKNDIIEYVELRCA